MEILAIFLCVVRDGRVVGEVRVRGSESVVLGWGGGVN